MYLSAFTKLIFLGLGAATQLPGLGDSFTEYQVQHSNGRTVNMYLRDSYQSLNGSGGTINKRFYKTYHNDTHSHEICAETNFVETSTSESALGNDCSAIITGRT